MFDPFYSIEREPRRELGMIEKNHHGINNIGTRENILFLLTEDDLSIICAASFQIEINLSFDKHELFEYFPLFCMR